MLLSRIICIRHAMQIELAINQVSLEMLIIVIVIAQMATYAQIIIDKKDY